MVQLHLKKLKKKNKTFLKNLTISVWFCSQTYNPVFSYNSFHVTLLFKLKFKTFSLLFWPFDPERADLSHFPSGGAWCSFDI